MAVRMAIARPLWSILCGRSVRSLHRVVVYSTSLDEGRKNVYAVCNGRREAAVSRSFATANTANPECHDFVQMEVSTGDKTAKSNLTTGLVLGIATTPTREEANGIAEYLVDNNLAACVQIIPGMQSVYKWKGRVEKAEETIVLIKTRRENTQVVAKAVKEKHSYQIPEIIFTEIIDGNEDYIKWALESSEIKSKDFS